MSHESRDYGDPHVWRDVPPVVDSTAEAGEGWEWIGSEDDLIDADERFGRAAIDALSAGEELLARDLGRLRDDDIEPDEATRSSST